MIELPGVQGSAEWLKNRVGMITGSRIDDVMAVLKRKEGESAARRNYRMELIVERLTGQASEHYVSEAMEHGSEWESVARAEVEIEHDASVSPVGFVRHPTIEYSGSSPDGLLTMFGVRACLEIKAPTSAKHLDWRIAGIVPEEHRNQMQWHMACTGYDWCLFASYDPRLPEDLQLFTKAERRDNQRIAELEAGVIQFEAEIQDYLAKIGKPAYWKRDVPAPERTSEEMMQNFMNEFGEEIAP